MEKIPKYPPINCYICNFNFAPRKDFHFHPSRKPLTNAHKLHFKEFMLGRQKEKVSPINKKRKTHLRIYFFLHKKPPRFLVFSCFACSLGENTFQLGVPKYKKVGKKHVKLRFHLKWESLTKKKGVKSQSFINNLLKSPWVKLKCFVVYFLF